jgi:hypothetical protein
VNIAGKEFLKYDPGSPLLVEAFRREGADYIITFYAGRESVGGGGVIRVKPNGRAIVEELSQ